MVRTRSYVSSDDDEEQEAVSSKSYHIWNEAAVSSMMGELASDVSSDLSALQSISNRLSDQEVNSRLKDIQYKAEKIRSKAEQEKKDAELAEYRKQTEEQNKKIEALEERFSSISNQSTSVSSTPSDSFNYDEYLAEHPYHETAVKFAKAASALQISPTRKLRNGQMSFSLDDTKKIYQKVGDEEGQEYLLRTVHNNDVKSANIAMSSMAQ